jgi:hypothetical protein
MSAQDRRTVTCEVHGVRVPAVVCCHLLDATETPIGFIENSSAPDDLQAWCDRCEEVFRRERALTDAFQAFHGLTVVCHLCYAALKAKHSLH